MISVSWYKGYGRKVGGCIRRFCSAKITRAQTLTCGEELTTPLWRLRDFATGILLWPCGAGATPAAAFKRHGDGKKACSDDSSKPCDAVGTHACLGDA